MYYKQTKPGFKQAGRYMNRNSQTPKTDNKEIKNTPIEDKSNSLDKPDFIIQKIERPEKMIYTEVSPERLKEAIIWSEILGKPMCKRRERNKRWQ